MGHEAMKRPAGGASGAARSIGRARFLPLALVELKEEAPSSMDRGAGRAAAGAETAPPGSEGAATGDGPSSMEAQGSPSEEEAAVPPGPLAVAARAPRAATTPR